MKKRKKKFTFNGNTGVSKTIAAMSKNVFFFLFFHFFFDNSFTLLHYSWTRPRDHACWRKHWKHQLNTSQLSELVEHKSNAIQFPLSYFSISLSCFFKYSFSTILFSWKLLFWCIANSNRSNFFLKIDKLGNIENQVFNFKCFKAKFIRNKKVVVVNHCIHSNAYENRNKPRVLLKDNNFFSNRPFASRNYEIVTNSRNICSNDTLKTIDNFA